MDSFFNTTHLIVSSHLRKGETLTAGVISFRLGTVQRLRIDLRRTVRNPLAQASSMARKTRFSWSENLDH